MSQSIPVSQQALWDVGVSAQAAQHRCHPVPTCREVVWDALRYRSLCWSVLEHSHGLASGVFSALPPAGATQRCCCDAVGDEVSG